MAEVELTRDALIVPSEVPRDIRTPDRKIAHLDERIGAEVEACGTVLTEIFGVGPIPAARIIGTLGGV